jgi:hypothetical protein
VTLDFGGFEADLFNTPAMENATINNIPPSFGDQDDQKNFVKLSFDDDIGPDSRLSKKRAFADSTLQYEESSEVSGEDYEEE